jgi:uncharacterized protein
MKRSGVLLAALLLSVAAFPVNRGLVTDDAHVFTQEEASALEGKLRAFEQQSSVEFAVVTVTSLDGMDIDAYRVALFKAWGIGKRGKDNGLLMVVAPNEGARGKVGIEVGYGLEGLLPDGAVGAIIRERIVPGWRSAHRADGLIAGVDAIIARLSTAPPEQATSVQAQQEDSMGVLLVVWFVGIGIVFGVVGIVLYRVRKAERERDELEEQQRAQWRNGVFAYQVPPIPFLNVPATSPPRATYVPAAPAQRSEPERRREEPSTPRTSSSYHDDSSSRFSSSSYDSGSSSSSSYDFGGGSSGGGGSSSDL